MERSSAIRYTYQDLLSIPETDPNRYEVIDGALYVTPGPRLNHQRVAMNLSLLLATRAREHDLGEVVGPMTIHVHDEMVFIPDVVFIRAERMEIADPEGHVHGVPDLAVEVLSPSNASYDRDLKRKHYLESGLPELWIVDARARTVEVWSPGDSEPERPEASLTWRTGDHAFDLSFEEIFRGVEAG